MASLKERKAPERAGEWHTSRSRSRAREGRGYGAGEAEPHAEQTPRGEMDPRNGLAERHRGGSRGVEPMPVWRRLLDGWNAVVGRFGFVQTLVILALSYAVLIGPAALTVRLARRDPLDKRGLGSRASAWRKADSAAPDLERAKLTT